LKPNWSAVASSYKGLSGFAIDEQVKSLGRDLRKPMFLELRCKEIEGALPVLKEAAS
jgi:hypothetical protein